MGICKLNFFFCVVFSLKNTLAYPADSYDFIVVGAGTSGCVVTSRLSESGQYSVLMLEAGTAPDPTLEIPALTPEIMLNFAKTYQTVLQPNAALANNGSLKFIGGRTLGGTSSINAMLFNRGSPHDYDNWANLTQDESWKYSNLAPYWRKIENYMGTFHSDEHGYGGPITLSRHQYAPGLARWLEAGQSLGYPIVDPNGPQRLSFSPVDFSHRFGRRVSSFAGYIKPYLSSRRNLRVITNAEVSQIIFEGSRAVGVKYTSNSSVYGVQTFVAWVRKEVVVSAGVIESPTLLMRSGIGPSDILMASKIPIIKDLPVGKNFHDQPLVLVDIILGSRSESEVMIPERDLNPQTFGLYNRTGDGPYSSWIGASGQAFLRSSVRTSDRIETWADIHLWPLHNTGAAAFFQQLDSRVPGVVPASEAQISIPVYLGRPMSRGTITLNPLNVSGDPLIDAGFLSHPEDIQVLLEAIKTTLRIYEETPAYRRIGARVPTNPAPACTHLQFRSDAYWECYIRQHAYLGIHAGGSCRMGRGVQDSQAVVDPTLRVIGVEGVRVADNSIMPAVTNPNTQAAAYVIGEKAADMILSAWNTRNRGWGRRRFNNYFLG